jgi:hypothetical protein
MDHEEFTEDESDLIPLSLTVARYIMARIATYLGEGWGGDFDIEDRPGLIDEFTPGTPAHHFLNDVLHFLRYISGVLTHNSALTYGLGNEEDEI